MKHTRTGYYVTIRYRTWRNRLCGPFATRRAAEAMQRPVRLAIERTQPQDARLRGGTYVVERVTGETLKPGTMDYSLLRVEDFL